ncbi:unnamed protein product, partial [Tetraodon nigroviridis]
CCRRWRAKPPAGRRGGAAAGRPPSTATTWTTWTSPGWSWSTTSSGRWVSPGQPLSSGKTVEEVFL